MEKGNRREAQESGGLLARPPAVEPAGPEGTGGPGDGKGAGRTNGSGFTNGSGRTNGSGFTNGSGRTNGSGFTNGSGRTNGSGFTNGSGRTNGSGFTNGSGRTNGSGLVRGHALPSVAATVRRRRRRLAAAVSAASFLAVAAFAVFGMGSQAGSAAAVDGQFGEWDGHTSPLAPANAAGLTAVGVLPLKSGFELYLAFERGPFDARADVWVFLDEDGAGATGFWDGDLGAEHAVRVSGDGGHVVSGTLLAFSGLDPFNASALSASRSVQAAGSGARLELQLPSAPHALSVAVVTAAGSALSGAFSPEGAPLAFALTPSASSGLVRDGIRIDGSFDDWAGVAKTSDPSSAALPARLDLLHLAAIGDDTAAAFYLDTRGDIMTGTLPLRPQPLTGGGGAAGPSPPPPRSAGTDLLRIYFDTDLNAATGARAGDIGAESVLQVEGYGGVVVACDFYAWGPAGWTLVRSSGAEAAARGTQLEAAVAAAGLVGARVRFELTGFEGLSDANHAPVVVGRQAGGLAAGPSPQAPIPSTRADALVAPIPEFSDLAPAAAGVALIAVFSRRKGRRASGEAVDDD